MSTPQQPHRKRTHHRAKSGRAELRTPDDDEEGEARLRMPVSSNVEDRDGDVFSAEGLSDLAAQLNSEGERIPMFLNHGRGGESTTMYGISDMVGHWDSADLETDGDTQLLYAEGTLYDDHPGAEAARTLLERDAPLGASIGFRPLEEEGDWEDGYTFHETDLLEISLVGIPSNPETVNAADPTAALAKAVGEASTDFDVDAFVEQFRDAVDRTEGREARDSVTDDDTDTGEDAGTTDDGEKDGIEAEEFRSQMLEMQKTQTELLGTLAEAQKADDEDEDDDEEEDDDEDDEKDTESDVEKTVVVDGEEKSVDEAMTEYRSLLKAAREDDDNVEIAPPETRLFEVDEQDDEQTDDTTKSGDDAGWL